MKSKIFYIVLAVMFLSSCEWLPLQTGDDYDGKPLDTNTNMSCLEFIESRQDIFSNFREAISICEMEDYYSDQSTSRTYLLLSNTALTSAEVANATTPDKVQSLKNILLYHIVQGYYHGYGGTLNYDPTYVVTMWEDPTAIMSLTLGQSASSFTGQDVIRAMEQCGSSSTVTAVSSNYFLTNGVAHVLDRKCVYKK